MEFKEWLLTEGRGRNKDFFFNYDDLAKDKWHEKLKAAKEKFKASFDTENDDKVTQRDITVDQNFWQHSKCRFHCEMRKAGGDWEAPVVYFRCQLFDGYADGVSKYGDSMFCFIPVKGQGNEHMVQGKKGTWCAPDGDGKDVGEPNEKKCWESLKKYLTDLVYRDIKRVKDGKDL